jgi:hypothetical protein
MEQERRMTHWDFIVVGGGIGGSALATVMARKGKSVLVLEQTAKFQDRVRGEWIAPWGVAETKRLGLYDTLVKAGGHHLTRHIAYDEGISPEAAEATTLPLGMFLEGIPGPLCIGHPHHCQTLFDEAGRAGASTLREAQVTRVTLGKSPSVTWTKDGVEQMATAGLIVAAEGRTSLVRQAAGIALKQDAPHHWFAGLLVDGVSGWDDDMQAIGTEGMRMNRGPPPYDVTPFALFMRGKLPLFAAGRSLDESRRLVDEAQRHGHGKFGVVNEGMDGSGMEHEELGDQQVGGHDRRQGGDPLAERRRRPAGGTFCLGFGAIGKIETGQILFDPLIGELDPSRQLLPGEVALAAVDRLETRAVHRHQFPPEQVEAATKQHEGSEQRLERRSVGATEIRDRAEIGT